jgi:hypothetical protein
MSIRDGVVALLSALAALAVSWAVMGSSGGAQREAIGAMERRLVERIDKLEAETERLEQALSQCKASAGGEP